MNAQFPNILIGIAWPCKIWACYISFCFALCSCGPQPSSGLGQRQEKLSIESPVDESQYLLKWGDLEVPLLKYANPEVYRGDLTISLPNFWDNVGFPIQLLNRGEEMKAEIVGINRMPWMRSDSVWANYPDTEDGLLPSSVVNLFRNNIRPGEFIQLRLANNTENIMVQSVIIEIEDPGAPYFPEVMVHFPYHAGELFYFQVIQEPGRRPIVRLDTAAAESKAIYELYRENLLYEIIHIPGFKTRQRLITGEEKLFKTKDIRKSVVLGQESYDWVSLPEYVDYIGAKLFWGEMEASPLSKNMSLSTFRENLSIPLNLRAAGQSLCVHSFQLIINSEAHYPVMYVSDDLTYPALQKALLQIQSASTVYFTEIIVEDKQGNRYWFPQEFAFNIW
jgi:hypothetical protein